MPKKTNMFGFQNISDDEFILYAKTCKDNGLNNEQILLEAEAINDLISLMKMRIIIVGQSFTKTGRKRKDAGLSDLISKRIGLLLEDEKLLTNKNQ
jgi:hypothetical protein